jgi:sugar phosphate isomerase/epimerase
MIKLGVNTVLYKDYSLRETVENLKKIGYDGFEISAIAGMCEHLNLDDWKNQVNEIKEICDEFQMPILATEVATTDPDRLRLAFEAAAGIGISTYKTKITLFSSISKQFPSVKRKIPGARQRAQIAHHKAQARF